MTHNTQWNKSCNETPKHLVYDVRLGEATQYLVFGIHQEIDREEREKHHMIS